LLKISLVIIYRNRRKGSSTLSAFVKQQDKAENKFCIWFSKNWNPKFCKNLVHYRISIWPLHICKL